MEYYDISSLYRSFQAPDCFNNGTLLFDNHTTNSPVPHFDRNRYSFYLIGLSFAGGLAVGFCLHMTYTIITKIFMSGSSSSSSNDGVVNLAFVGNAETNPNGPVDDAPPDYTTVVETNSRKRSWFQLVFRKMSIAAVSRPRSNTEIDVSPPSYNTAVRYLERDLCDR